MAHSIGEYERGQEVTLLASAAQTATSSGSDAKPDGDFLSASGLEIVLDITAVSGTSPTLDVEVHFKVGDYYGQLVQFARATTTGRSVLFVQKGNLAYSTAVVLVASPTVAGTTVGVGDGVHWGETLRVFFAIGGTATPTFTFSVTARPWWG